MFRALRLSAIVWTRIRSPSTAYQIGTTWGSPPAETVASRPIRTSSAANARTCSFDQLMARLPTTVDATHDRPLDGRDGTGSGVANLLRPMSTTSRDYYEILGVPRDADDETIKKAFRRLARELHPDVNPEDPTAEERFKEVAEAYKVLSEPETRQVYDRHGHAGLRGAAGPDVGDFGSFQDIFDAFFGGTGMFGGRTGGRGASRATTISSPPRSPSSSPRSGSPRRSTSRSSATA